MTDKELKAINIMAEYLIDDGWLYNGELIKRLVDEYKTISKLEVCRC